MSDENLSVMTRDDSGIVEEMEDLTREEVRAIKKMCEAEMHENGYQFQLGGKNWADLDKLRRKCKTWLVENQ